MCNEYLKLLEIDCSECPFFEPEASCVYSKDAFVDWIKRQLYPPDEFPDLYKLKSDGK